MADPGVAPPRLAALTGEERAVVAAGLGFVVAVSLVAGQDAVRDTAARLMAELQGAAVPQSVAEAPAPVEPSNEDAERVARAIVRFVGFSWADIGGEHQQYRIAQARAAIIADRTRPR